MNKYSKQNPYWYSIRENRIFDNVIKEGPQILLFLATFNLEMLILELMAFRTSIRVGVIRQMTRYEPNIIFLYILLFVTRNLHSG